MVYPGTKTLDLELSSSQYASITDGSQTGLDITGDITIEAWIKPESITGTQMVASKLLSAGDQRGWYFSTENTGFLRFAYFGSGTNTPVSYSDTAAGSVVTDEWQHVAVTVDVSTATFTFYVNGEAVGDTVGDTSATSIFNSSADFAIGCSDNGIANYFDGDIGLVRVWDDIRTQSEIQDNACLELGSTTNLQGEWSLDDVYTDGSGNGNTLTASGAPVFSTDIPGFCLADEDYSDATKSLDLERSSSQYAKINDGDQTGLDITGDITVEAWIKLESDLPSNGDLFTIASKGAYTSTNRSWVFGYWKNNTTAKKYLILWHSPAGSTLNEGAGSGTNTLITVGEWTHVAVTSISNSLKYYINGTQVLTGSGGSFKNSSSPFHIGGVSGTPDSPVGSNASFDGKIGLVRVWNDGRTASEIADNTCTVFSGTEANLQGQWIFDDTYTDATVNQNNLTSSGSPVFASDVTSTCAVTPSANSNFLMFM